MMRSLYSAVAGLKNHQTKMDVIGNNISNVNTVAFKSSSVTFSDIIYQTISGASGANANLGGVNAKQIGLGMSTAATSMAITNSGSAQTTGKPFDLRITDAGNTTNFFIVNNGTENVYTRDGCFYIDGAGTLCMDSTGYRVMGWAVNEETGEITQGELVPMTVMETKNLTSAPEATEAAYAAGIIDKDTPDLNSTAGYTMELSVYDDRGYPYSCRFTVKNYGDNDDGQYTIRLSQILDQNGVDVLANAKTRGVSLSQVFGTDRAASPLTLNSGIPYQTEDTLTNESFLTDKDDIKYTPVTSTDVSIFTGIDLVGKFEVISEGKTYYFSSDGTLYDNNATLCTTKTWGDFVNLPVTLTAAPATSLTGSGTGIKVGLDGNFQITQKTAGADNSALKSGWYFVDKDSAVYPVKYGFGTNRKSYPDPSPTTLPDGESWAGYFINPTSNSLYMVTNTGRTYALNDAGTAYTESSTTLDLMIKDFDTDTTSMEISGKELTASYTDSALTFSTADGTLTGIGEDSSTAYLVLSALGDNFKNVVMDFSELKNVNNGKKSTANFDTGVSSTDTTGMGKKLGNLTGVAVQNDGRLFGSYDNGNTVLLGQIASAHFANASGLQKIGESCYNTTLNSGEAVISDISSDGSSMTSGEIEMSNVDLSAEFTDMITTQRGFQANSRVITTSDTLLEELINLKR